MFLGQPFIVGGSRFNCKGTDDTPLPFYLRAIGAPIFSADGINVSIDVRVASMTEMLLGRARLETGISKADLTEGRLRRTDLPDSFQSSRRTNLPTTLAEPVAPPEGCVYSVECASISGLLFGDECPDGYPWSNPLSLDTTWYNQANYRKSGDSDSDYHVGDDTCNTTTGICTCATTTEYRYHCCDSTHANKLTYDWEKTLLEFNSNYNTATKEPNEEKSFNDGKILTTSAAYFKLKAVINVDLTASHFDNRLTGFLDHANIPSGIQKVDAYVEGEADMIAKATIKSGSFSAMLGPYTLLEKTNVLDIEFFVGYFPVHVSLDFGLQAVLEVSASYTFPSDIILSAQAKGSVKYGAVYANNTFTQYNDFSLDYNYQKPDLAKTFKDSTVTGDIKLTIVPTVYATVYGLIPLEFQFNLYAGLDFIKYPEITTADSTRKCSGLGGDLYYQIYCGVEADFRVRQLVLPTSWTLSTTCITTCSDCPCFGDLKLVCLTSSDAYYKGFLTGSTVLATSKQTCADQSTGYCKCLQFDATQSKAERMFSADPSVVYWAKFPKSGILQILPKTPVPKSICAVCSGCADMSTFYKAISKFEGVLETINSNLQAFVSSFKSSVVSKINQQLGSSRQSEYLTISMISGVKVCSPNDWSLPCTESFITRHI
jgi:hypothetical protein